MVTRVEEVPPLNDKNRVRRLLWPGFLASMLVAGGVSLPAVASAATPYLGSLSTVDVPGHSTVPANGDINPYGVAVVPRSTGRLVKGDILISNFNAKSNLQGTGTTIVELDPSGAIHPFAKITAGAVAGRCPGGVGLSTALVALSSGWVIVGSLPTRDGTAATAGAGCLIVLDAGGGSSRRSTAG